MRKILNNKKMILFELLIITVLIFCLVNNKWNQEVKSVSNLPYEKETPCEKALINTYLDAIQKASDNYYAGTYKYSPVVSYYYVMVKQIKMEKSTAYITFCVMPYLGAHNVLGEDEAVFSASYTGEVKLEGYKRVKTDELPEGLLDKYKVDN